MQKISTFFFTSKTKLGFPSLQQDLPDLEDVDITEEVATFEPRPRPSPRPFIEVLGSSDSALSKPLVQELNLSPASRPRVQEVSGNSSGKLFTPSKRRPLIEELDSQSDAGKPLIGEISNQSQPRRPLIEELDSQSEVSKPLVEEVSTQSKGRRFLIEEVASQSASSLESQSASRVGQEMKARSGLVVTKKLIEEVSNEEPSYTDQETKDFMKKLKEEEDKERGKK